VRDRCEGCRGGSSELQERDARKSIGLSNNRSRPPFSSETVVLGAADLI
jgi:hypothetical protein